MIARIAAAFSIFALVLNTVHAPIAWAIGDAPLEETSEQIEDRIRPAASEADLTVALEKSADQVHAILQRLEGPDAEKDFEKIQQEVQVVVYEAFFLSEKTTNSLLKKDGRAHRKARYLSTARGITEILGILSGVTVMDYGVYLGLLNASPGFMSTLIFIGSSLATFAGLGGALARGLDYFDSPLFGSNLRNRHGHNTDAYFQSAVDKRSDHLYQVFWNRLRAHGYAVPRGNETTWLSMRMSSSAEEAALLSSKKRLIREATRFKEAVLNTSSLYDVAGERESHRILQAFGNAIEVPHLSLRIFGRAQAMRRAFMRLQESKKCFRKLAQELQVEKKRPIEEILRMPFSDMWGLEGQEEQIRRLLGPQNFEATSFLLALTYEDLSPELLMLLTRADRGEIRLKTTMTHELRVGRSQTLPIGVHLLRYQIAIEDLKAPSRSTLLQGEVRFGSKLDHVAEVAKSPDWKAPFAEALRQSLQTDSKLSSALCVQELLPQVVDVTESGERTAMSPPTQEKLD